MDWSKIPNCLNGTDSTVASLRCLPVLFANVIDALLMFAGTIAAIFLIISGIRFITAGGDAKQLETAQKIFTYALGGLILIFLSFLVLNIIATVTGVDCILIFGPFTQTLTVAGHTITNCTAK